jgi:hypothetical protein
MHEKDSKLTQKFGQEPEGKRPLERPRQRGVDNIKLDLDKLGERGWTDSM